MVSWVLTLKQTQPSWVWAMAELGNIGNGELSVLVMGRLCVSVVSAEFKSLVLMIRYQFL